jgi:hypothetical protein
MKAVQNPVYTIARAAQRAGLTVHQVRTYLDMELVLAYTRDLSHSEIARHLKQPMDTVKTWIRRGLHTLKRGIHEVSR